MRPWVLPPPVTAYIKGHITSLWLARNEVMDPYSSPYIIHYSSFHFLFHSFIPSQPKAKLRALYEVFWLSALNQPPKATQDANLRSRMGKSEMKRWVPKIRCIFWGCLKKGYCIFGTKLGSRICARSQKRLSWSHSVSSRLCSFYCCAC